MEPQRKVRQTRRPSGQSGKTYVEYILVTAAVISGLAVTLYMKPPGSSKSYAGLIADAMRRKVVTVSVVLGLP